MSHPQHHNSDTGMLHGTSVHSSASIAESQRSSMVDLTRVVFHHHPSGNVVVAPGHTYGPPSASLLSENHATTCSYSHYNNPNKTTICKE